MMLLPLSAQLAILGWSLLGVSLLFHAVVFLRVDLPDVRRAALPGGALRDMPAENAAEPSAAREVYDAVIVGAGWAGLRAAQEFVDHGHPNILILEAGGYVGGRSKTWNADGSINDPAPPRDNVPIEAGSEWLYHHNGMASALNDTRLLAGAPRTHPKAYSGLLRGARYYRQSLRADGSVRTRELRQGVNEHKERVLEEMKAVRKERLKRLKDEDGGLSPWGERFTIPGDESWADAIRAYKSKARSRGDEMYVDLLNDVSKIEYTCDSDQMSLRENNLLDSKIPSTTYMGARGVGFGNVAARFGERFSSNIRLNSRVIRISQYQEDGGGEAVVKYVHEGKHLTVAARAVVVTASLGVLKRGSIKFDPLLPRYKQEVIDGMGFGLVNKCAMYWNSTDDVVWPENKFWFKLIGAKDDRWTSFFNPSYYKGVPTLTAWVGGEDALRMERKTDEEVMTRYVMKNLLAMFPDIRHPDRVVITRWHQDENFRGTYSYMAAHREWETDTHNLRKRVGRLWFAGEATAHPWHGTTVGAWNSGKEAARDMMKRLTAAAVG